MNELKDELAKLSKRQKTVYDSLNQEVDNLIETLEHLLQLQQQGSSDAFLKQHLPKFASALKDVSKKVSDVHKDFHAQSLVKFGKDVDKHFNSDIEVFYRNKLEEKQTKIASTASIFDETLVKKLVLQHLIREGYFDVVDVLEKELNEQITDPTQKITIEPEYKLKFKEMFEILQEMQQEKKLDNALSWCIARQDQLLKEKETVLMEEDLAQQHKINQLLDSLVQLEFKLHKLKFIEMLKIAATRPDQLKYAIEYSKKNFCKFYAQFENDVKYLMGSILYVRRLDNSPYKSLLSDDLWEEVTNDFKKECCAQQNQPLEAPLYVVTTAGATALPHLLKLLHITKSKPLTIRDSSNNRNRNTDTAMQDAAQNKEDVGQLGIQIDLDPSFVYHSIFACPVSKEMTDDQQNPAVLLPCGHVLAKNSATRLIRGNASKFKCPYCPTEATLPQCKTLHF